MEGEQSQYSAFYDFIQKLVIPYIDTLVGKLYENNPVAALQAFKVLKSTLAPMLFTNDLNRLTLALGVIDGVVNSQVPGIPGSRGHNRAKSTDYIEAMKLLWLIYEDLMLSGGKRGLWERQGGDIYHATMG